MDDVPQVKVVEGILSRIANHNGVLGLLVISPRDGSIWKTCISSSSPFDEKKLALHAEKLHAFVGLTRSITRTLDVGNELLFLRIRSKKYEFIVSPERGMYNRCPIFWDVGKTPTFFTTHFMNLS